MKLNKTETKRLLNVKDTLEDMFYNGKLNKYGIVSPFVAKEIADCYNGIVKDIAHSTVTGFTDVKNFFEKKGFIIENMSDGSNGWNIYISNRIKKLAYEGR